MKDVYKERIEELINELESTLMFLSDYRNEQWYLDILDRLNKLSIIW